MALRLVRVRLARPPGQPPRTVGNRRVARLLTGTLLGEHGPKRYWLLSVASNATDGILVWLQKTSPHRVS